MLGEIVMEELKQADEVAFVRYASVYRRFQDIEEFEKEIESLRDTPTSEDRKISDFYLPRRGKKMIVKNDIKYMDIALDLAIKGINTCMPNPRVGCVIVKK